MFSFSKVLAFGLVAFSSVRAIPVMQISCSVNFGTSVGPTHAFDVLDPGVYQIVSQATGHPVDAPAENSGLALAPNPAPVPSGLWQLERADQGGFTLTNVALGCSIFSRNNGYLICGSDETAETFAIEPAGEGVFIIKDVVEDEEWTVTYFGHWPGVVLAPSRGAQEQLWRFIPVST
ncbi:hypothetical protein B0H19DRAFT_1256774 [Mycena capillaripes]|nr:hypothetical protein B0H19DRAFT_1256774 [Mycena capillaripes]